MLQMLRGSSSVNVFMQLFWWNISLFVRKAENIMQAIGCSIKKKLLREELVTEMLLRTGHKQSVDTIDGSNTFLNEISNELIEFRATSLWPTLLWMGRLRHKDNESFRPWIIKGFKYNCKYRMYRDWKGGVRRLEQVDPYYLDILLLLVSLMYWELGPVSLLLQISFIKKSCRHCCSGMYLLALEWWTIETFLTSV